jgi:hypothetical protein
MRDEEIIERIDALTAEQRELRDNPPAEPEDNRPRLTAIEIELDQLWDLQRQREALREFGEDPGSARVRPASTVEDYRS